MPTYRRTSTIVALRPNQGNPFSTTPDNIAALVENGKDSVEKNKAKLDEIAAALIANQKRRAA